MCCWMCTSVPPGRQVNLSFLRGQKNVHTCHHSKLSDDVNKNKQKWCYCQNKNFSGTNGTIRQLPRFKIISNEMLILLLILCPWYFSCLQMYSERNFLIFTSMSKYFFKFFGEREIYVSFLLFFFFWEIITHELFKFH